MERNVCQKETFAYRVIAACSFGTILEWYDFSIYAYLAPILAPLFFPDRDRLSSIILAYSVFAAGFLVRPLGAILFGHFAGGGLFDLIIGQFVLVFIGSAYQGAITKVVLEMFPANVRCSAAGLGYNLTYAIVGGTAPMIAVYMINKLNTNLAPGLYMTFGALISLIAIFKLNGTNGTISERQ